MPFQTHNPITRLSHLPTSDVRTVEVRRVLPVFPVRTKRRPQELTRTLLRRAPDEEVHGRRHDLDAKGEVLADTGAAEPWVHGCCYDGAEVS